MLAPRASCSTEHEGKRKTKHCTGFPSSELTWDPLSLLKDTHPRPPTKNRQGLRGLFALLGVRREGGTLCSGTPLSSHPWCFRTPGRLGAQQPLISS